MAASGAVFNVCQLQATTGTWAHAENLRWAFVGTPATSRTFCRVYVYHIASPRS